MSLTGKTHVRMWSKTHTDQIIGTVVKIDRMRHIGSSKETVILEISDAIFLPKKRRRTK